MHGQWASPWPWRPAVRQPAHDALVAVEHLLAVDAQVLPWLVRALRDDQAPGDEWCHIARPAVLDGQAGQIDIVALPMALAEGSKGAEQTQWKLRASKALHNAAALQPLAGDHLAWVAVLRNGE